MEDLNKLHREIPGQLNDGDYSMPSVTSTLVSLSKEGVITNMLILSKGFVHSINHYERWLDSHQVLWKISTSHFRSDKLYNRISEWHANTGEDSGDYSNSPISVVLTDVKKHCPDDGVTVIWSAFDPSDILERVVLSDKWSGFLCNSGRRARRFLAREKEEESKQSTDIRMRLLPEWCLDDDKIELIFSARRESHKPTHITMKLSAEGKVIDHVSGVMIERHDQKAPEPLHMDYVADPLYDMSMSDEEEIVTAMIMAFQPDDGPISTLFLLLAGDYEPIKNVVSHNLNIFSISLCNSELHSRINGVHIHTNKIDDSPPFYAVCDSIPENLILTLMESQVEGYSMQKYTNQRVFLKMSKEMVGFYVDDDLILDQILTEQDSKALTQKLDDYMSPILEALKARKQPAFDSSHGVTIVFIVRRENEGFSRSTLLISGTYYEKPLDNASSAKTRIGVCHVICPPLEQLLDSRWKKHYKSDPIMKARQPHVILESELVLLAAFISKSQPALLDFVYPTHEEDGLNTTESKLATSEDTILISEVDGEYICFGTKLWQLDDFLISEPSEAFKQFDCGKALQLLDADDEDESDSDEISGTDHEDDNNDDTAGVSGGSHSKGSGSSCKKGAASGIEKFGLHEAMGLLGITPEAGTGVPVVIHISKVSSQFTLRRWAMDRRNWTRWTNESYKGSYNGETYTRKEETNEFRYEGGNNWEVVSDADRCEGAFILCAIGDLGNENSIQLPQQFEIDGPTVSWVANTHQIMSNSLANRIECYWEERADVGNPAAMHMIYYYNFRNQHIKCVSQDFVGHGYNNDYNVKIHEEFNEVTPPPVGFMIRSHRSEADPAQGILRIYNPCLLGHRINPHRGHPAMIRCTGELGCEIYLGRDVDGDQGALYFWNDKRGHVRFSSYHGRQQITLLSFMT